MTSVDMAALPALSSDCLRPCKYDPRAAKTLVSLDSSCQQQECDQHHEQQDESIACRWFDSDALASLGLSVPDDLELWRLRLRFGLPTRVALGERFRVAIDLVDEMGQPPPPSKLLGVVRSLRPPLIRLIPEQDDNNHYGGCGPVESPLALRLVETPTKTPAKWVYDAVIERDEVAPSTIAALSCILLVAFDPASDVATSKSAFHRAFRGFCARSVWLSDRVLVLPFQSERIHVKYPPELSSCLRPATTICTRRLFSVPSWSEADTSERPRQLLTITENYGDAMGAHIWDASILLSFSLIEAALRLNRLPTAMMELGAGCGLFACVFRALYATGSNAMILTERPESAMLLQSNVAQNDGVPMSANPPIEVVPLVWGHLPLPPAIASHVASACRNEAIGVVFAADVLYYWNAHAALLSTLESLSSPSNQDAGFQVIIAHKHRGIATSRALGDVLARCGRRENGIHATRERDDDEADAWRGWYVDRLARLGKVDLLRLTRKW